MKPLALLLTLVMCGPALADDAADLIKQLDAENFQEREKAAEKLEALGKASSSRFGKSCRRGDFGNHGACH